MVLLRWIDSSSTYIHKGLAQMTIYIVVPGRLLICCVGIRCVGVHLWLVMANSRPCAPSWPSNGSCHITHSNDCKVA